MNKSVNIIGVGNMGGGMALNLIAKAWRVGVSDIDPIKTQFLIENGAFSIANNAYTAINSIAKLPHSPAATIIAVVDAAQTNDVLFGGDGLVKQMPPGHTVLLCPTISPIDTERIAHQLSASGIHTIDAPMSGGPARAREGTMSLMIACERAVYQHNQELINDLSNKVFSISERIGDAAKTKLVNNLLAAINLVGAAEALALAEKLGLNMHKTLSVIEQSSGQSWIGSDRMHRALAGDFVPKAHVTLLAKDTGLALHAAEQAGFEASLGGVASQAFQQALKQNWAAYDDGVLLEVLRVKG
jgi:putative dehydrogenase